MYRQFCSLINSFGIIGGLSIFISLFAKAVGELDWLTLVGFGVVFVLAPTMNNVFVGQVFNIPSDCEKIELSVSDEE